jgi:hypothetical protein
MKTAAATAYAMSIRLNLVEYRRKISPRGLVVKANGHEGHRLYHAEAVLQAPSEQSRVSSRDKNPRPQERTGICDERLDISVALANHVSEETDHGRIRYDSSFALGDNRCPLFDCPWFDRVTELAAAVVTMYASAKPVAFLQI